MPVRSVDTVIVGAGQAGLLVSARLRDAGREHVLLERRPTLGGGWQDRWDAFRLVGPNWTTSFDGFPYRGDDPDGFMPRDEIIAHVRAYAAAIRAPVELETDVTRLAAAEGRGGGRFRVETSTGSLEARSVVVAGGPFQRPHIPALGAALDPSILQLHSHDYRIPAALPPGGVLLVGSGQTGVQLAEELLEAGRPVTMAVGRCGRVPRTYRGKDAFWWLRQLGTKGADVGTPLPTAATLPSPRARFNCNPQLSGHGRLHDVNLRAMASTGGLRLTGRLEALDGTRARFAADLEENLAFADRFFVERFKDDCDAFAQRTGLELPEDDPSSHDFQPDPIAELDLAAERIGTVVWTSGYRPGFDWVDLRVLDEYGLPITRGGLTDVPGLAFIGTPWMVDMGSSNLVGLERDVRNLAARLD